MLDLPDPSATDPASLVVIGGFLAAKERRHPVDFDSNTLT